MQFQRLIRTIAFLGATLVLAGRAEPQCNGLKIYISADMEGVVGAVTGEQPGPSGFEYGRFRELMTREVLAAIDAAKAAPAPTIRPTCVLTRFRVPGWRMCDSTAAPYTKRESMRRSPGISGCPSS